MAKQVKKRSEIPAEYTWNLMDIYENKEAWEQEIAEINKLTQQMVAMEGKVCENAQSLLEILDLTERVEQKLDKAFNYAERLFDQDQREGKHQAMSQKMYSLFASYNSQTAFIFPEILEKSLEDLLRFKEQEPGLKKYERYLRELYRTKEHRLDGDREKLLAMTEEMSQTPSDVYSIFHNADLIYPEITDEEGQKVRLSHGNFVPFQESADRRVRQESFEKYYSVYQQFAGTMAALYNGQIKQQIFCARSRKYGSTLEAAVDASNVPVSVYHNLIETINENLDKMHGYVSLRKKCLGLDELHMYDIYTPMISDVAKEISYEEAKETVLKALAPLGEEYVSKVKEGFDNRWIDVYENEGKRSGAYSSGVYGVHPYVLLNHHDTLDNMFTIAHEMGHAMHSYYSDSNQPYLDSQYRIFVAEVASTCNEVLLIEYLLAQTEDKAQRMYLLNHYLDSFKGTVYRQTMFAEFEMRTNALVEEGESLTAEVLCDLYKELNEKYYGKDMISDDQIAYEWARIPHFYYNFYVYQYATGYCAAVAIAHRILKEGQAAVEDYKKFLKGGCSLSPVELLRLAGVDMASPKPVQEALDIFENILKEMESLI